MKRHAPYIAVIIALAAALGWTAYLNAAAGRRIDALEAANQNLGHVDALIQKQVSQTIRASLEAASPPCRN
jgi:hypothetical protein